MVEKPFAAALPTVSTMWVQESPGHAYRRIGKHLAMVTAIGDGRWRWEGLLSPAVLHLDRDDWWGITQSEEAAKREVEGFLDRYPSE